MTRKERWILSEWLVARAAAALGQELVEHQYETPYAEIDLLFRNRFGLTIFEVKSWNSDIYADFEARTIITRRQLGRLERARQFVEARTGDLVRLQIAVVSHRLAHEPRIRVFDPPNLHPGY